MGFSSYIYSHSILRGSLTGLVAVLLGTLMQGATEEKAAKSRLNKGITGDDLPVRRKISGRVHDAAGSGDGGCARGIEERGRKD